MASALITNVHYVDPVLPEQLPLSIIEKADALPAKVAFLDGILAPETGARLARLLQITNSYYSNMIEGQFTELADMQRAQNTPRRERQQLQEPHPRTADRLPFPAHERRMRQRPGPMSG